MDRLARLYLNEIVARHDMPILIIFDHDDRLPERVYYSDLGGHAQGMRHRLQRKLRRSSSVDDGEGKLIGPEIAQETTEKISQIKDSLKAARDRQKSYTDNHRKSLEFNKGDHVLLKVSPCKGVPVEILEHEIKKLKRSRIPIVKVRWNLKQGPEYTWEREDQMKLKYPHLFSSSTS
ncbi:hypothetical protein Tco_0695251 [Tanacetum coccineum]